MFFIKTNSLLKIFIFSSLLLIEGLIFAEITKSPISQNVWQAVSQAVWKVTNPKKRAGTGFFVDKNHLITSLHVIVNSLSDPTKLKLSQDLSHKILNIKRIVAIDLKHDLAVLEIEGEVNSFLNIKDSKSSLDLNEEIRILGYPQGGLSITDKIKNTQLFFYKFDTLLFPFNEHLNLLGASGSPFLDKNGSVVAVLSEIRLQRPPYNSVIEKNYAVGTNFFHLNEFLKGKTGLNCLNFPNPILCYQKEVQNITIQANNGDPLAQYLLTNPRKIISMNIIKNYFSLFQTKLITDRQSFKLLQNLSSYYLTRIKSIKNTKQRFLYYTEILSILNLADQFTDDILLREFKNYRNDLKILNKLEAEFRQYLKLKHAKSKSQKPFFDQNHSSNCKNIWTHP